MTKKYHFNRKKLLDNIDKALNDDLSNKKIKNSLVSVIEQYIKAHSDNIKNCFMDNKDSIQASKLRSKLIDSVILTVFDILVLVKFPISNPTTSDYLSIIATGGYGRKNLAPGSDIDILILTPYKITPRIEKIAETLLYVLWDLKLKVGYAVRSLEESISKSRSDNTICTSLIDARLVAGNQSLWLNFQKSFKNEILNKEKYNFFYEKLKEKNNRHKRMGDSTYLVEPNVKEGKGGIRDLNTIKWIISFIYQVDDISKLVNMNILSKDELLLYNNELRIYYYRSWTCRNTIRLFFSAT